MSFLEYKKKFLQYNSLFECSPKHGQQNEDEMNLNLAYLLLYIYTKTIWISPILYIGYIYIYICSNTIVKPPYCHLQHVIRKQLLKIYSVLCAQKRELNANKLTTTCRNQSKRCVFIVKSILYRYFQEHSTLNWISP